MTDLSTSNRQFSMEGATHLYSSLPTMLTPADLYSIQDHPAHKIALSGCNIYLIVRRHRIYLNPQGVRREGRHVRGDFLVMREEGRVLVPFVYDINQSSVPPETQILDVAVADNGTGLMVVTPQRKHVIAASVLVACAQSELVANDTDLDVLYVGQGIGRKNSRNAHDRLLSHTKLQQILAETITHAPECEVLLLLYRFEHGQTLISNGGDFNLQAQASAQQDKTHFNRLTSVKLERKEAVALAEAGLISYFKPYYNTLLKTTNFAAKDKLKVLKLLMKKGITGLIVELCTANLRSRIGTKHAVPKELTDIFPLEALDGRYIADQATQEQWQEELKQVAHSHHAEFPLTTPEERNTFLHGSTFVTE